MRLTMRWTKLFPLLTGALILMISVEESLPSNSFSYGQRTMDHLYEK